MNVHNSFLHNSPNWKLLTIAYSFTLILFSNYRNKPPIGAITNNYESQKYDTEKKFG